MVQKGATIIQAVMSETVAKHGDIPAKMEDGYLLSDVDRHEGKVMGMQGYSVSGGYRANG